MQLDLNGIPDPTADEVARDYLAATLGVGSPTITSVSGGKTSAYMALHYPSDHYVFAVVLTRDPACRISDPGLLREIRERCPVFEGSRELDQTLINILRLEQELGKPITWVWGSDFDRLIEQKQGPPNSRTRFCTQMMKILPIYRWVKAQFPKEIVEMRIGYRADEANRVYRLIGGIPVNGGWDWSQLGACEKIPRHRKKEQWRFVQCPLYLHGIQSADVRQFWIKKGWDFPAVSNCDFCFFHRPSEHHEQFRVYPERAQWWIDYEEKTGRFFGKQPLKTILMGDPTPLEDYSEFRCLCTD